MTIEAQKDRVSTGVAGLDEVLDGGLIPLRFYLARGGPGQGKTTLGLHFLSAGEAEGEKRLFISFQETEEQIRTNARSLGLDLENVEFLSLVPDERFFTENDVYDVFHSSDVERDPLVEAIVEVMERVKPSRVFVDSMTQLRFIAPDTFQYRKQTLSFLRFLAKHGATVLFTSENSPEAPDHDLQFLADGVINLTSEEDAPVVKVSKFRGSDFRKGNHGMRIGGQGLKVFPRMLPAFQKSAAAGDFIPSGVPEVDQLLNGGLEGGTVSLISGPSGIGKSTLSGLFAKEAGTRGIKAAIFLFEEEKSTYLRRLKSVNVALDSAAERGDILVEQIEPMRYLADEFSDRVRRLVKDHDVGLVLIDSVGGYEMALGGGSIKERLHALTKNLTRLGVSVILVNEVEAMTGQFRVTERAISYLSDNIIFLRYVEVAGKLTRAVGVLKKRLSGFDPTLRAFEITPYGVSVGERLDDLQGILSGTPRLAPQDK